MLGLSRVRVNDLILNGVNDLILNDQCLERDLIEIKFRIKL